MLSAATRCARHTAVRRICASRGVARTRLPFSSQNFETTSIILPRIASRSFFWSSDSNSQAGDLSKVGDRSKGHPSTALMWHELNSSDLQAWEKLGWTRESWDEIGDAQAPPTVSMFWKELSPRQRYAAKQLGYDQKNWDEDDTYSE